MAAKKGTWIAGTLVVAAVIGAGTWFGAVNPTLSGAASLRAQTDQVNQSNDLLQMKVKKLASDFQKLPQYKQQLEALRIQIPTTAELSDYIRQLQQIADAHGVVVTSLTADPAQAVELAIPAKTTPTPTPSASAGATPTPTPTPTPSSGTSGTGTAGAAGSSKASGVPAGMAAIPLSITVIGTYDNTVAFLGDLQTATPRLFLVSGFTGTGQKEAAATAGKPATNPGFQELVVTGFLYVLPDPTAAEGTPAPTATALPPVVPGKNPLLPVAGK